MKVHKPIKVYGGHVYEEHVIATKIVSLKKLQSREANKGFNESYIEDLYGKIPEEMVAEGMKAAEQVWRQKHPDSKKIEFLAVKKHPDSSNSSVVEGDGSDFERPSIKEVSLKIGSTAVKSAGIKKLVETGLDESDSPELNRFDKRVLELMKPLETDVDGMSFRDDYKSVKLKFEHLLDPNYVPSNNVEDAAVRNPKGVPVSESSFNAAKEAIDNLAMNPSLMQIINPERALDSKALINNIRSSHLTRCRLFEYLTSSLDRLAVVNPGALADRVLRDSEDNLKAPNYLGGDYYAGKMRSREYTVVLAIAMMDGSFDVDRQDKTVTHYRGDKERSGMHRDSARALLEYVRNNY